MSYWPHVFFLIFNVNFLWFFDESNPIENVRVSILYGSIVQMCDNHHSQQRFSLLLKIDDFGEHKLVSDNPKDWCMFWPGI